MLHNETKLLQQLNVNEDNTNLAKTIIEQISTHFSTPSFDEGKNNIYFIFSTVLRNSPESAVNNLLSTIETMLGSVNTELNSKILTTINECAKKALKDFERWGCQIARYCKSDEMKLVESRYVKSNTLKLKDEMEYGEQSFKDAENALKLCMDPQAQPSNDGPLSFLNNEVKRNEYHLRIAVEYLINCHYVNSLKRGSGQETANLMKSINLDGFPHTPLAGYAWASDLVDEIYGLAKEGSVDDVALISDFYGPAVKFDGYVLIYDGEPLSFFIKNPSQERHGINIPSWFHGQEPIYKHWPRLESLFNKIMKFPLDTTDKVSLKAFYDPVIETIWLLGNTTPVIRGTGKLVEQIFTMAHLRHDLRTPLLRLANPQIDVLNISYPLSVYKKRFLYKFFELESLPPPIARMVASQTTNALETETTCKTSTHKVLSTIKRPFQNASKTHREMKEEGGIELRLKAALDHVLNVCVFGSRNKIEDIERTGGWIHNLEYRYRTFGRYVKCTDDKYSEENDIHANGKFDHDNRTFKHTTQSWYYKVDNIKKVYSQFSHHINKKTNEHPLDDPRFNLKRKNMLLFCYALFAIEARSGDCLMKSALVSKYLWENPDKIFRITGLCMSELDHILVAVNLEGHPYNPYTWTGGWIIDAWYGLIFPAIEFNEKIKEIKKFLLEQRKKFNEIKINLPSNDSELIDRVHWDIDPHNDKYPTYKKKMYVEDYYEKTFFSPESEIQLPKYKEAHEQNFKDCLKDIKSLESNDKRAQFFKNISLSRKRKAIDTEVVSSNNGLYRKSS